MSSPIETYGKSGHTGFKLQLCKEHLKQTCLQPTNKLHPWEYCACLCMVCIALSAGRSLPKINDFSKFVTDSETTLRDPYTDCEPIWSAPMNFATSCMSSQMPYVHCKFITCEYNARGRKLVHCCCHLYISVAWVN